MQKLSRHKPNLESTSKYGFSSNLGGKRAAFWACTCKLSCTLFSPAQVQPLNGAGREESSGTGLGLAMIFLRDSLCLSAVSLSQKQHDILDFSYCPLSRVSHVTLANWQRFGFEFHLRSSPSAYSGFVNVSQPAEYFTACYTVLTIPNKVETAFHGCNLAFSFVSIVSLLKLST